jgi:hypothetical protein
MTAIQGSLWDVGSTPGPRRPSSSPERSLLDGDAWVDVHRDWLAGAGTLFDELVDAVPWRSTSRVMYDRVVDVPRLESFYGEDDVLPHPALDDALAALAEQYDGEAGGPPSGEGRPRTPWWPFCQWGPLGDFCSGPVPVDRRCPSTLPAGTWW